jgi:acetyltransferase-like isoleucine patch superfamily enzyme
VLAGVHIDDPACIEIGNDVTIRENAVIRSSIPRDDDPRDSRWVGPRVRGKETGIVKIGDHSRIAFNALLLGYGGIQIGEKCGIGPGSIILSETYHHKGSVPGRIYKYSQGASPEELCVLRGFVELKDGAGVASAVTVLPGATIGRDSWIGPHSVVRLGANIADGVIAKGDPAKIVLQREFDNDAVG